MSEKVGKKEETLNEKDVHDVKTDQKVVDGIPKEENIHDEIVTASDKKADVVVRETDKVIKEEVKESGALFSIQDLIDALSIVISSGKMVEPVQTLSFIEIANMQIEKPKETEIIDAEISFEFDPRGEWCLAIGRQRLLKEAPEKYNTYVGFIKGLHHLIEGTTKEFYRIMRVKRKLVRGVRHIIDPLVIGFDATLDLVVKNNISMMILNNLERFSPVGAQDHDTIPIVLNPALQKFNDATQEYILRNNVGLREWMELAAFRKALGLNFGVSPIYGENNTRWLNHAHPQNLSVFLSQLPKINLISISYSMQFVFQSFALSSVDISQVSQTMEINSNRAEPVAKIINSPVTSENYDDFRKIMTALVLPQQVLIDIEYNKDENATLSGVAGLMSKMLFSTTPGFRTISLRSARETDVIIGRMLQRLGYSNVDQRHPLKIDSPRGGGDVWLELETHDVDGLGWVNSGVNGVYVVHDPLYVGIGELPSYAGLNQYIDILIKSI